MNRKELRKEDYLLENLIGNQNASIVEQNVSQIKRIHTAKTSF